MKLATFSDGLRTYSEWRPARLRGLVEVIWCGAGPTMHRLKRVLPNGMAELIVNFGDPYRVLEGAGVDRLRGASLSGLQTGPLVIEQPEWQDVLGIRLRPAGAYAIFARPMRDLTGRSVDLYDVAGRAAGELRERCREAACVEDRFRIAAAWVWEHSLRRGVEPAVGWAAARIEGLGGAVAIYSLRERIGWSKTRLASAFREQIGVTPKLYSRLVRFGRARAMLQTGDGPLADVAVAAGYYDQPHMNAEFRQLGGMAPAEFLALRHPVGDGTTAVERG